MEINNLEFLVQELYNNPNNANMNNIYGTIFSKECLYVLLNPNLFDELENIKPFSIKMENNNWILCFTDLNILLNFKNKYLNQSLSYMCLSPKKIYDLIKPLEKYNIEGICFNKGYYEWKNSFKEIDYVIDSYLKYYNMY